MSTIRDHDPNMPGFPPDGVDQLLADANPLTGLDPAKFDSARGFDDLFRAIVATAPDPGGDGDTGGEVVAIGSAPARADHKDGQKRRRRPRRTAAGISLAVLVVLGGATAAAASWRSAHTGQFGHKGDTEDVPGVEWLNLTGDDMPRLALTLAKGIPYPPGDNAQAYIPKLLRGGGLMQSIGVTGALEADSECAWWGYWLQSNREGDAAEMARATTVLGQVPTWPAVVRTDGGGVVALDKQIATAARVGDVAFIENVYTANSCATLPQLWAHK